MPKILLNKMRKLIFLLVLGLIFQNCTSEPKDERKLEEVKPKKSSKIQDIIRNPVTANGATDTINVAKMTFVKDTFFFGTVKEGKTIETQFVFENTGKAPLLISDARSTCGCTIPKYPKEPIEPGAKGKIQVKFNTANKNGYQDKPITLLSNTYPNETVVRLIGEVKK